MQKVRNCFETAKTKNDLALAKWNFLSFQSLLYRRQTEAIVYKQAVKKKKKKKKKR
jgi:hypothetical protein